jgi:hypothetical protein
MFRIIRIDTYGNFHTSVTIWSDKIVELIMGNQKNSSPCLRLYHPEVSETNRIAYEVGIRRVTKSLFEGLLIQWLVCGI